MQITRLGGTEVLDVVDLPDPVPGDGQQLFGVSTAGVDYADTHHRESWEAHDRSEISRATRRLRAGRMTPPVSPR